MDFKKFAAEASTVFNRAVQYTEEKLGTTAEKTELDAHFENLLQRADQTKEWTEKVVKGTEQILQPNPTVRMEEFFYDKLDKKKRDRITNSEHLGGMMCNAGNAFGPGTSYGNALLKCGQTQMQLGQTEKDFVAASTTNFLVPLKTFLDGDMKTIQKERHLLEVKRLDLDAAKSKLRKARSPSSQTQAEQNLRVAQSEFDRQSEITKLLLEGVASTHTHHMKCLNDFIEGQVIYYAQCQKYMVDLQRQLGSYSVSEHPVAGNGIIPGVSNPIYSSATPSAPPIGSVQNDQPPKPLTARKAKVLYDYDAADKSELSLLADEIISVWSLPGQDPDWMMAERGSQRGKVPMTYIEIIGI